MTIDPFMSETTQLADVVIAPTLPLERADHSGGVIERDSTRDRSSRIRRTRRRFGRSSRSSPATWSLSSTSDPGGSTSAGSRFPGWHRIEPIEDAAAEQ